MPAPFGVTTQGFSAMTVDEAQQLLESDFQGAFGAGIDVSPQSNFGQLIGVTAERLADVYAMGQDTYNAGTPDGAAGAALDFVNGLRGVVRLKASSSTVLETLTGTASTALAIGRIIATSDVGTQFQTSIAATLPPTTPAAWTSATVYAQGAVVAASGHLYLCTVGGTSGPVSGPTGYGSTIIDNTVTWAYAGEAVTTWATGTTYTAANPTTGQSAQRVTDGTWVYLCTGVGGGTSTDEPNFGAADKVGTSVTEADGYTWLCVGQGVVAIDVPCASVLTGPQAAGAGVLTAIVTSVSGWLGAYNVLQAVAGENLEMDDGGVPGPGYRIRAEQEIRAGGAGYLIAIEEAVLAALIAYDESNAQATVTVYENASSIVDSSGRPPNSIEVVVNPKTTDSNTYTAIATAIFNSKPVGIQLVSEGGTAKSITVLDSEGVGHVIVYSVVASERCYASLTVHIDPTVITEGGLYTNTKAAIAAILSTWVTGLGAGRNLPAGALASSAFGLNLAGQKPGILDVTLPLVGSSSPAGAAYVAIDDWHFASLAKGDITVTIATDDL